MPSSNRLCINCQERSPRPHRNICNLCVKYRHAQKQLDEGLTCASCNRPPTAKTPLAGKAKYGANYCPGCLKHKDRGTEPAGPPRRANTPKPMPVDTDDPEIQRNRRSLAHWLEAHRRTVAKLAA